MLQFENELPQFGVS